MNGAPNDAYDSEPASEARNNGGGGTSEASRRCQPTASRRGELSRRNGGIMDRIKIAEIVCLAICSGSIPAMLGDFVFEQAPWIVVSATGQSDSERRFLGMAGLHQLIEFCRKDLKIISGEMTGCVIKEDCLFAFGKVRIRGSVKKSSAETSFVVNLVWSGLRIVSAQLRIMWPLPPYT
jgi:hypothetical protein